MYQLQLPLQGESQESKDSSDFEPVASKAIDYPGRSIDLSTARGTLRRIIGEEGPETIVEIPADRVLDLVEECDFWKQEAQEMGEIARRLEKIADRSMEMLTIGGAR